VKLLYFAWGRQKTGKGEEALSLPAGVSTVNDLVHHLVSLGGGYGEAFAEPAKLRAAINQNHAGFDALVRDDDEVAFFPPVTGGIAAR
jgi:sulfur-carrier protein